MVWDREDVRSGIVRRGHVGAVIGRRQGMG